MTIPDPSSDFELYDTDIEDKKAALQTLITESRWAVDFTALLALYAGVTTVFILLVRRAFDVGLDVKLASGLLAAFFICVLLYFPTMAAIQTSTEVILLKIRQLLLIPYDSESRHLLFRSLWKSLLNTIQITAIWGTGLFFSELIKNASFP